MKPTFQVTVEHKPDRSPPWRAFVHRMILQVIPALSPDTLITGETREQVLAEAQKWIDGFSQEVHYMEPR